MAENGDIASIVAGLAELMAATERRGVTVHAREIRPGLPDEELRELEEGPEIELASEIRAFYRETNGISFRWSVDPTAFGAELTEEDAGYVGGEIAILDLFTMIM